MNGFDWDDANIEHIARHGVRPEEAEEAMEDPEGAVTAGKRGTERRFVATGRTSDGRLLSVVFTRRGDLVRVVTARNATNMERRRYTRRL